MEEYGFEAEEVTENLRTNKHDHVTTTYYLLLKKQSKSGVASIADLCSIEYYQYITDPKNLISYKEEIEEKIKSNQQSDSLGKYSFSTPKNKDTNNDIFDDSLEKGDKSERSEKIDSVCIVDDALKKKVPPESKKFIKIEKPIIKNDLRNNKRNIKNMKKELACKINANKDIKHKKEHNKITKRDSSDSDKKTTITINNVNTNISINTTINLPQNTEIGTILLDSHNLDLNKLKILKKEPITKPDDYIKVIVNNNVMEKVRGI